MLHSHRPCQKLLCGALLGLLWIGSSCRTGEPKRPEFLDGPRRTGLMTQGLLPSDMSGEWFGDRQSLVLQDDGSWYIENHDSTGDLQIHRGHWRPAGVTARDAWDPEPRSAVLLVQEGQADGAGYRALLEEEPQGFILHSPWGTFRRNP